ncbi:MAG: phosphatase PAP2 family protein [Candidatus Marinimicrobia bacterium]|nr:phosphatase PAP2 family protein [Candidatus Neomarinimicrobiota bacterium]
MRYLLPTIDSKQMVEVDRLMIKEFRISLLQMMEHAGRHLARLIIHSGSHPHFGRSGVKNLNHWLLNWRQIVARSQCPSSRAESRNISLSRRIFENRILRRTSAGVISKLKGYRPWFRGVVILIAGLMSLEAVGQVKPSRQELLRGAIGVGLAVGIELYAKDHFMPMEPRFSAPNRLDTQLRNKLYWGQSRQNQARVWSDRLIYGVSLSSLVWGPVAAQKTELAALINMEVFAINSMITNLAKITTARERPYHYFGTSQPRGAVDYASFFSGHSSIAFSQAVTNAMLLSDSYPERSGLIWSSLISAAGLTAYLRVAGDMHYCSDIVIGGVAGSLIAWSITRYELARFDESPANTANFRIFFKMPLG